MLDRLLHLSLNACAIVLILATAILAICLGYGGCLKLLNKDLVDAGLFILTGLALGAGTYLLCINKRDLTYG
jgi:hypothetical protein